MTQKQAKDTKEREQKNNALIVIVVALLKHLVFLNSVLLSFKEQTVQTGDFPGVILRSFWKVSLHPKFSLANWALESLH